jgi:hypothetical protein
VTQPKIFVNAFVNVLDVLELDSLVHRSILHVLIHFREGKICILVPVLPPVLHKSYRLTVTVAAIVCKATSLLGHIIDVKMTLSPLMGSRHTRLMGSCRNWGLGSGSAGQTRCIVLPFSGATMTTMIPTQSVTLNT